MKEIVATRPAERFRIAGDLFETGVRIMRQNLGAIIPMRQSMKSSTDWQGVILMASRPIMAVAKGFCRTFALWTPQ